MVTSQDHILGQVDSYPGGGAYPTSMWSPGQVIRDEYWIPITSAPLDPVAAQLQVGLYQHRTHQRLAALDARGQTLNPPILERVKISVPTLPPRPAQALEANLDNRVQLIGYDLPSRSVQAGAEVTLTLFWRVTGELSLDYTVMLHLLDADDRLVGQGDGPPRNNTYPTSFWAPGETLTDRHSMRVFDQTKPGKYRVAVGLYDPTTEQRLPVLDMQGNVIGDRVFVGMLESWPVAPATDGVKGNASVYSSVRRPAPATAVSGSFANDSAS